MGAVILKSSILSESRRRRGSRAGKMKEMLQRSWTSSKKYGPLAKFTLEFLYYGYHHLIPRHYIFDDNRMLYADHPVFEHCVKCKYDKTLDFMMRLSLEHNFLYYEIYETIQGAAAKYDRLNILRWILNVALRFAFQRNIYDDLTWDKIPDALVMMSHEDLEPIFRSMMYSHGIPRHQKRDIAIRNFNSEISEFITKINSLYNTGEYIKLLGMII